MRDEIDIDEFERQCELALQAEEDFNIVPPAAFTESQLSPFTRALKQIYTTDAPGQPYDYK